MNKIKIVKGRWMEGLLAGLMSFFAVWLVMLIEVRMGLILIKVPVAEYVFTSMFSALFMGVVIGLLFAYSNRFFMFDKTVYKGVAFFAIFEILTIIVFFFIPESWNDMVEMYRSSYAFMLDVILTVIIGGFVIGVTYDYLIDKKVVKNMKRPLGLLLIIVFTIFSALFSLLEVVLGLSSEFQALTVTISVILLVVSYGLYLLKKWGLYAAIVVYVINLLGVSFVIYFEDISVLPSALIFLVVLYYLLKNKKLFNK